jgi:hypothetical protein
VCNEIVSWFVDCLQDVVRTMAEKIGFRNPADDCLCFSLHECRDGVTSTLGLISPGSFVLCGPVGVAIHTWIPREVVLTLIHLCCS